MLYHMLLSAGGFAHFRTQMNVFDVLRASYGDLGALKNKRRMMKEWLQSRAFMVSGLDAASIEAKVLSECRSAADFQRIVMEEVAQAQGVDRWADSTPTNIPYLLEIKRGFPDALVVHIIRDGRNAALSLDRHGWSRPLPWDRKRSLLAAGLYWEWIVRKGRNLGALIKPDYIEVRYEDLVNKPRETLAILGRFIDHDLDYERIRQVAVGSVRKPLTTFSTELEQGSFNPIDRFKTMFSREELRLFESLVGSYLAELGYQPVTPETELDHGFRVKMLRVTYSLFYGLKQLVKSKTKLSRFFVTYSNTLIEK
jgi:Sulfotransferase family